MKQFIIGLSLLILAGCQRAPSVDILGSFFPIWIFCITFGIILAVVARWVFIKVDLAPYVGPPLLIYPCLAGVFGCSLWLLFFR